MAYHSMYNCKVVTPEGLAVEIAIFDAVLPAHDGLMGIMPGHSPMLCRLKPGLVKYHDIKNPRRQIIFIEGGIAHIHPESLTILTHKVIRRGDMTFAEVEEMMRRVEAMRPKTEVEMRLRTDARDRANALLEMIQNA